MDPSQRSRPQYVIEHMEEDDPEAPSVFPQWALLECDTQCSSTPQTVLAIADV